MSAAPDRAAGPLWPSGRPPLPGGGRTARRFAALWDGCLADVSAGRLAEADADADAILAELEGGGAGPGEAWGVWAAEPPSPELRARRDAEAPGGWLLDGVKPWCSGIGTCTHALVTARVDGAPRLFAADLGHPGVRGSTAGWATAGMAGSATGEVAFAAVPARTVGDPRDYLDRAGFWHGGIGVAACWLGGAAGLRGVLAATAGRGDRPHARAHLGAVDAALRSARWMLDGAAAEIDADPGDAAAARIRALRGRTVADRICAGILGHVGRGTGAGPMSGDPAVAGRIADVLVYTRQCHAERDEDWLGELLLADPDRGPGAG